jgi:hypothetical protein
MSGRRAVERDHVLVDRRAGEPARASLHAEFMRGKITLIGCPKLDGVDYSEKLADIVTNNDIKSLTVARMEAPCCGGIEQAAAAAALTIIISFPMDISLSLSRKWVT